MKQVYFMLFLLNIFTSNMCQEIFFQEQSEKQMPFTLEFEDQELADAENQISPQALSEEDISVILFNQLDFGSDIADMQEDVVDAMILINSQDTHNELLPELTILSSESQKASVPLIKSQEELFLEALENFMRAKNILTKETLSSNKVAKSQGKLLAKEIKDLCQGFNISISHAQNIARNYIQEKCQDLHLGILKHEKKSLKKLLEVL